MFKFIRDWRRRRIIRRFPVSEAQWQAAFAQLPLLDGLSEGEQSRLRELVPLFLHHKSLEAAQGLVLDDHKVLVIALQACLPILELGLDWYDGWVSIVVYPEAFRPQRTHMDEYGIVHRSEDALSGEAWERGVVILSWADAKHAGVIDGHTLVIHEFAHKLDMLNGSANGFPPLHAGMDARHWSRVFGHAYENFQHHHHHGIDPYAATDPAEFFAVLSEVFFERPQVLHHHYPEVYKLLRQFYRQDTLARMQHRSGVI
jgi:Mlc titration factor MtfA (ptsG expression regulator)